MTTSPTSRVRVSIVGGSGYTGGELLRLLSSHPHAEVAQVSSRRNATTPVSSIHPHLRGRTTLEFCRPEEIAACDVMCLCMPHGESSHQIDRWAALAPRIVDLSADFRLRDPAEYRQWYGSDHPAVAWLNRFVYGLPETRRERLRTARLASGVGCNATAVNLAILPLAREGLIKLAIADLKVGSSEAGAEPSATGHHPERVGRVRPFATMRHRHQAEVRQELGEFELHTTITSVELVRGVQCTAHVLPTRAVSEKDLWKIYRAAYAGEPFVRVVKAKSGLHRYPEPKLLSGTNFCDVAFDVDPDGSRIVVVSALDNLVKGAAGSAVQCMNLMCGFDETEGLGFAGLHPL
ncbi:MAG: N-acetyl-gamma-glutamyl-phosphate reductase [Phycisphaerales bacterium]|nr:N-acetyl-gamma-glutamyl-phosphate reductase [Phycisphaerales bacterium]